MMLRGSHAFVVDEAHCAEYAEFVRTLVEADGTPVVVHCSAGKDRTGWAIALVLLALGVPEDVVVADVPTVERGAGAADGECRTVDRERARSRAARTPRPRARGLHLHVARAHSRSTGVASMATSAVGSASMRTLRSQLRSVFLEPAPTA